MAGRLGLKGHGFDLDDLLESFRSGDPAVIKIDDSYFLVSAEFEAFGDNHVELMGKARELLTQMQGAARITNGQLRGVELDGSIHDPDGRKHAVVLADPIEVRSRVGPATVVPMAVCQPRHRPPWRESPLTRRGETTQRRPC